VEEKMKTSLKWIILSILLGITILLTFFKVPDEISKSLHHIARKRIGLAGIMHGGFFVLFLLGLIIKKLRTFMFTALLLILSGTASVIAIKYRILPNIIVFITFFVLTAFALKNKELNFDLSILKPVNIIIGFVSIFFSFYYLHWVEPPVFFTALLYSPLGILNCPTMLAFCGFLCLLKKPGSIFLEFFVASATVYFGFFGLLLLGAYIDIILIASGMFLLVRLASRLDYEKFYRF